MLTIEKKLDIQITYPLERLGPPGELLFFDIETTGFSGDYSNLYLIGCAYQGEDGFHLIQWFAERADAEEEVLHAFFGFIRSFRALIHFNGDGFDIPYLLKRCSAYNLNYNFDGIESIDILKRIRPFKKLLGLESLKQKSIEQFLRIRRQDPFNGGQLISVYERYLTCGSDSLCRPLLLHNEEDLKGMPSILPILFYPDILHGSFGLKSTEMAQKEDIFGKKEEELILTYEGCCPVPIPVQFEIDCFTLELQRNLLRLTVPILNGELKHFYPDYQNYYYLIYEDNAVHQSVGQYVEKNARKKATAKTCYTRVTGVFLPQPSLLFTPCLRADYKSRVLYAAYSEALFADKEKASIYLEEILRLCSLR